MGLAFEIYDDISLNPTLEDIFHYAFAHSGILTGMYSRLDIDEFLCSCSKRMVIYIYRSLLSLPHISRPL